MNNHSHWTVSFKRGNHGCVDFISITLLSKRKVTAMVAYACNPSMLEAETRGLGAWGKPFSKKEAQNKLEPKWDNGPEKKIHIMFNPKTYLMTSLVQSLDYPEALCVSTTKRESLNSRIRFQPHMWAQLVTVLKQRPVVSQCVCWKESRGTKHLSNEKVREWQTPWGAAVLTNHQITWVGPPLLKKLISTCQSIHFRTLKTLSTS